VRMRVHDSPSPDISFLMHVRAVRDERLDEPRPSRGVRSRAGVADPAMQMLVGRSGLITSRVCRIMLGGDQRARVLGQPPAIILVFLKKRDLPPSASLPETEAARYEAHFHATFTRSWPSENDYQMYCFPEKTIASGRTSVVAVTGEPAMLWWFIGAWLGSAAIVPILWLLSVAYPGIFSPGTEVQQKQAVSEPPSPAPWRLSLQVGRYSLAGLFTVAGLVLAFVGLSSDPPVTMSGLISSSSPGDAQATPPQFASAGPTPSPIPLSAAHLPAEPAQAEAINESGEARHEPPLPDEAGQITSSAAQSGSLGESIGDQAHHQEDVMTALLPVLEVPRAAPIHRANRVWKQRRTVRAASPQDTQQSRGTWLWPVHPYGGG
jgi:hypothetical protein